MTPETRSILLFTLNNAELLNEYGPESLVNLIFANLVLVMERSNSHDNLR